MATQLQWYGDKVERQIRQTMSTRLTVAANETAEYIRESISGQGRRSNPGTPPSQESGELGKSIFHQRAGILMEEIGSDVNVAGHKALWMEFGTGIYGPNGQTIVPVNANMMVWETTTDPRWNGMWAMTEVDGTQPRPFLQPGLIEMSGRIVQILCAPIA